MADQVNRPHRKSKDKKFSGAGKFVASPTESC